MVELRSASPDDTGFLFQVYRDTNIGTFEVLGPEMCETLLRQQSSVQESQYDSQYPKLERHIILVNGNPVGRLYLDRGDDELVLVNIAILPSQQKKGAGTRVLQDLIRDAKETDCVIRLHVAQDNPAAAWYRNHGFAEVGLKEPYVEMVLNPI